MGDLFTSETPLAPEPPREPAGDGSVDVLRKLAIVAALVLGYVFLHRFATPSPDFDPRGLLALGFVILAAFSVGELAEVIRFPHITGYLIAGVILGPSMAHLVHDVFPALPAPFDEGVLNERVKGQLTLFDDLALALIALTAGGEMRFETVRRGLKRVLSIGTAQILAVGSGAVALVFAISGPIPFLRIEEFAALGPTGVLAIAAVVAALAIAQSPAVTIAVINSSGSKGETTDTVLSLVVLLDIAVVTLFSAASVAAASMLGLNADEGAVLASVGHIVGSVAVGISLGLLILAYLRYVGAELLLFLVSVIYGTAYLTHQWHLELALVFIFAGFVVANLGDLGDRLIHEVERLSLPVYVVFFTLAGSKLHLDIVWEMLAFAVCLALVRAAGLFVGTRAGGRLVGASPAIVNFGWMCCISQAGLAISMANTLPGAFPGEIGDRLFALALSTIAINEMVGPVLLQWGLTLSGDLGGKAVDVKSTPEGAPVGAEAPEGRDVWGPELVSGSPEIDQRVAELERELRALVVGFDEGPLQDTRDELEEYIAELRRDFLRGHRRALVAAQSGEALERLPRVFLDELAALGDAWRDRVLDRAARARAASWSPGELVGVLDALVAELPESVRMAVDPASLEPRPESWPRRVRRAGLRAAARLGWKREVDLRALGRYHLGGRAPAKLEGVAALVVNEEGRLAYRTATLFAAVAKGWEHGADLVVRGEVDREQLVDKLVGMRGDVEEDFAAVLQEVQGASSEGARRAELVLGGVLRELKLDVVRVGTLDLPHRARRFSRVYADRNAGLRALTTDLAGARRTVGARMAAVALDLELVALEGRTQLTVEQHADQLARDLRGRGPLQLERVDVALGVWLDLIEGQLAAPDTTVGGLSATMRSGSEDLGRVAREALRAAQQLRAELAGDEAVAPLLRTLLDAAQSLTDWYVIPSARVPDADWKLPPEITTLEVPFRDLTIAYIESNVTVELGRRTSALADAVGGLVEHLHELDRVIVFNVELAASELDLLPGDAVLAAETRTLVGEMLAGAIGRTRMRLRRVGEEVAGWPERGADDVRTAVLDALRELRGQVVEGRLGDLWTRLFGDRRARRDLLLPANWSGIATDAREQVNAVVLGALGPDRLEHARQVLGLPGNASEDGALRVALAPPKPRVALPVVYRRLFSERALEAGDLTIGRERELGAAQAAIQPGMRLRSCAIVGLRGSGTSSLATAVTRSWQGRVRRIDLDAPVGVEDVERWFVDPEPETLTVLTGVRWVFQLRPGGFAALDALARSLVEHGNRDPWLLTADAEVWDTASRVVALEQAVGTTLRLGPLDAGDLAATVLARHQMSGFELDFDAASDLGWQLAHLGLRGVDVETRRRQAWFRTLHEASGGMLHDGLRLWLASILEVDQRLGRIRIGPVPRPPVARLSALDDEILLVLVQMVRQGWMDDRLLSALYRVGRADARRRLVSLVQGGLLVETGQGRFDLAPHLRGPVHRALRARGWL